MPKKIAVIGTGYLGIHHARIYAELDDAELVAVVDSNIDAAKLVAQKHGGEVYTDFREVLGIVDAVSIVTPTTTHYDIAMECLRAGKDILLEKPITETVAQADEIIALAKEKNLIVQVGLLERYNPAVLEASNSNFKPVFIESERVAPFQPRGTDVDVTLDLMIHDIDIVMSFFDGQRVTDIKVAGSKVLTDKIDVAKAWLEFESGGSALITASRIAPEKKRALQIHTRDSFISVDYQSMKLTKHFRSGDTIATEQVEVEAKEPLKEEIIDFVARLNDRNKPKVSAVEGRNALDVALKITEKINKVSQS